jgi:hypothetical protein
MNFRKFVNLARPDSNTKSDLGYLYHATNEENLQDIKSSGKLDVFSPSYGTDQDSWPDGSVEDRSYWTEKASSAWYFAPEDGRPLILRTFKTPTFKRELGTGDYYSTRPIPVSALQVLTSDGSWIGI